jgi:hypothetical protein
VYSQPSIPRSSRLARLLAVGALAAGALAAGLVGAFDASAHHPGSHAWRLASGDVRVETVVTVPDSCTHLIATAGGAPKGIEAPADTPALTLRLNRTDGPCAQALRVLRQEITIKASRLARTVHLYVVAPGGDLASTERVPIRE